MKFLKFMVVLVAIALLFSAPSHAQLWGNTNMHAYNYECLMDTTNAATIQTVLDYTGEGVLYVLAFSTENNTGHDPYVCIDVDGYRDTLTVANSTNVQWLMPYDTPDDDTAAMDYFNTSDNSYARCDIYFKEYLKVYFWNETVGTGTTQTLLYMSYGKP